MNVTPTAPIAPGTRVTVTTRSGQVTGTVDSRDFGPSGYSLSITLDPVYAHLSPSGSIRTGEEKAFAL